MADRSVGAVLATVLVDLGRLVVDGRTAALADEPDAVHRLRTAVRRVRNVLVVFADCFEAEPTAELAACLSSYGDLLGRSRDLEVRAADAGAVLDELGLGLGLADALGASVIAPLLAEHRVAHRALVAWHAGPDVRELDRQLGEWMTAPPFVAAAARPASKVAAKVVRTQVRRVLVRADRLERDGTEEAVHAVRRAARRLRHAADAVEGVPRTEWVVLAGARGQRIQGILGDHRDALLLADHVRECSRGGDDAASYGLAAARAEALADEAMAELGGALKELRDGPVS
ncbi:MAG: CHAD domain-containing protein [Propionibacteriales bacterium]|nr:CHAD domain-containing protein [Propionibacteriales bacterium]